MKTRWHNEELIKDMIDSLEGKKRQSLTNALDRNFILTSVYSLEKLTLTVYKEGWYLELDGTRSRFAVFFKDNDGELEVMKRKPNENKLSFLYKDTGKTTESDFSNF